jgi:hypothetical protein
MGMLELNVVSEEMVSHLSKKEAWHPQFKIPQRSQLKVHHFKASKTRKFHSLAGSSKGGASPPTQQIPLVLETTVIRPKITLSCGDQVLHVTRFECAPLTKYLKRIRRLRS